MFFNNIICICDLVNHLSKIVLLFKFSKLEYNDFQNNMRLSNKFTKINQLPLLHENTDFK